MTKPGLPRYSKAERAARKKEIDLLRRRAVTLWNHDQFGEVGIVLMSFSDYLVLVPYPIPKLAKLPAAHIRAPKRPGR